MDKLKNITRRSLLTLAGTSILVSGCGIFRPKPKPKSSNKRLVIFGINSLNQTQGLRYFDVYNFKEDTKKEIGGLFLHNSYEIKDRTLLQKPDGSFYYYGSNYSGVDIFGFIEGNGTVRPRTLPIAPTKGLVILPSGNLMALVSWSNNQGAYIYNQATDTWGAKITSIQTSTEIDSATRCILGPDGKLYVAVNGSSQTVRRYIIGANDTFTEDATFSSFNSGFVTDMRFSKTGELILVDGNLKRLVAFNTNTGTSTQKSVSIPNIRGGMVIGTSVYKEGDEIIFVAVNEGIVRVDYTTGDFRVMKTKDGLPVAEIAFADRSGQELGLGLITV
jgi:hypothetical protein